MKVERFSEKQLEIFRFAQDTETKCKDFVAHGAVRTGKTICIGLAFLMWAMDNFDGANFGICGKTVNSAIKNIVLPLLSINDLKRYYTIEFKRSMSCLVITFGQKTNYFYIFGGSDESSQDLIQGITLSGLFLDEVALMPESFVNQAIARTLSVKNCKRFYNCNPENPNHFFYTNFIQRADERNIKVVHFRLEDNPALDEEQIKEAMNMYIGVFYDRYILGKWVKAEGLVYPYFDKHCMFDDVIPPTKTDGCEWYVSMDYGTMNPTAMHLWCVDYKNHVAYIVKEYYYDGRKTGVQKTDTDYYCDLVNFTNGYKVEDIIIDPSAASFIAEVRKYDKFNVRKGKNDVIEGIRTTGTYLKDGKIKVHSSCLHTIQEFGLYSWGDNASKDSVIKEDDHAMDSIRYFCYTILKSLDW